MYLMTSAFGLTTNKLSVAIIVLNSGETVAIGFIC